uniref:Ribonuclease H-like domain-containing protein n=1 Tax=Tanacetum cinerariifolium TaxID=118510 RepID=A0A699H8A3_TANCI|nr:ribonuclease H-like domain-containing protein [Tanacetum cinerariifolium]
MYDEYNALIKNGTWLLVSSSAGVNMVRSMWLFKHKFHADGTLSRYKARLIASGSSQQLGVDFDETFSPVVKPTTVRTILSLVVSCKWHIYQFDVKNAFLNGDLSETVYVHQPTGFVDNLGLLVMPYEVDFIIVVVIPHCLSIDKIISPLNKEFDMTDLGTLNNFLGISADHTPIVQQIFLYMHDPRETHFAALKRILRYVRGTMDFGLHLYVSATTSLVCYTDADSTGFPSTRRSTSGYCVFLEDNILSWSAKRQHTISRSSAEAEYRGVANVVVETAWVRNLLRELHSPLMTATLFTVITLPSALFEDFRSSSSIRHPPALTVKDNTEKDKIRAKTGQNQEQMESVEKSKVKPDKVKAQECSSCGALYTTDYCCSNESLEDKIIYDLDKTPDLSQRPLQKCPKCENPVDGQYCQGCALLRKKFKEDMFTYCIENGILQDSSEPSNNNTNVVNALQEPFVVKQDPGYNCLPKVSIIPNLEPSNNQTIDESPQTLPSFDPTCYSEDGNSLTYDSTSNLVHDSPNVFDPPLQPPLYLCEFYGNDARRRKANKEEQAAKTRYWKISACYDDDDDDDYTITITHKEPDNSLSMVDEHLDTIPATESDEFIKSSVENLVPNPSESEGEYECDVPACEDFTTFSNILFDADYDFSSVDDQSFYDKDIVKEIYSNPLFDEEIISMKIDPHYFNVESDLIESLLNHDSSIISPSLKIDSLFDEFIGELTLLKSISPGINETDCDPKEETRFIKRLLYDNSSPRPPEEFISKNSNTAFESFSPSPIPVEDSDSLMEEIDLSFTPDNPMPPGIEEDDYDSERDILIREELLSNNSLSLPENESFHFDIPSSSRPHAKPQDGNSGILNVKVMGDISEHNVPLPRLMSTKPTLVPNQEKSPNLLSHLGHEAFQPCFECPMIIYRKNTHILDVLFFHFYPP